jgi:hypothetical protein
MKEIQIIDTVSPGDKVEGPFLRPEKFHMFGMADHVTAGNAIAIRLLPYDGDHDFPEPVTVVIQVEDIEFFMRLIRTAQALMPKTEGGSA